MRLAKRVLKAMWSGGGRSSAGLLVFCVALGGCGPDNAAVARFNTTLTNEQAAIENEALGVVEALTSEARHGTLTKERGRQLLAESRARIDQALTLMAGLKAPKDPLLEKLQAQALVCGKLYRDIVCDELADAIAASQDLYANQKLWELNQQQRKMKDQIIALQIEIGNKYNIVMR